MPLAQEVLGTNADGSKNEDYCIYCYKDGKFLQDCTMEEMIEHCAQFVDVLGRVTRIMIRIIMFLSFLSLAGSNSPIILNFITLVTMNEASAMKMVLMVNRYKAPSIKRNCSVASP